MGINPSYPEAYKRRGLTHLKLKKEGKAIKDFISAFKLNSQDAELYKYLACTRLKLFFDIVSSREDIIVMPDKNVNSNYSEMYNHLDSQFYASNIDLQANIYDRENLLLSFNEKLEKFGQVLKAIIDDFNYAIQLNPNDDEAYKYRGRARVELRNYKGALEDFSFAWQLNPNDAIKQYQAYTYFKRGSSYFRLKEYQKAIFDYSNALQIQTDYFECLRYRGEAYLFLGKYEKAIADLNKALLLKFKQNYIIFKLEKAREALNKSSQNSIINFQFKPHKQSSNQQHSPHINHAKKLIEQKYYRQAIEVLNLALNSSFNDAEATRLLSYGTLVWEKKFIH